jgi:hypothetical protein
LSCIHAARSRALLADSLPAGKRKKDYRKVN